LFDKLGSTTLIENSLNTEKGGEKREKEEKLSAAIFFVLAPFFFSYQSTQYGGFLPWLEEEVEEGERDLFFVSALTPMKTAAPSAAITAARAISSPKGELNGLGSGALSGRFVERSRASIEYVSLIFASTE
jgi:hypothetical protein